MDGASGGIAPNRRHGVTTPVSDRAGGRAGIRLDPRIAKCQRFVIRTVNNPPSHDSIQSARLKSKPLTGRFRITHAEFIAGGESELAPGPSPNGNWRLSQ